MPKEEIPKHIKDRVWEDICEKVPYSVICEKWQIKSKSSINTIKKEYQEKNGITEPPKPISRAEKERRTKIGRAAITVSAFRKAEYISEGFVNAFEVIAYNAEHLMEIIEHSKTEADTLKVKQEEILSKFEELIDIPEEENSEKAVKAKSDIIFAIKQSIQKINDFFARDMIRIKAVGEMRKHLETFLKMKQEIMDIQTIKKMLDAFFAGCEELDDNNYRKYRDRVIAISPVTARLFTAYEQQKAGMENDLNSNKQE